MHGDYYNTWHMWCINIFYEMNVILLPNVSYWNTGEAALQGAIKLIKAHQS